MVDRELTELEKLSTLEWKEIPVSNVIYRCNVEFKNEWRWILVTIPPADEPLVFSDGMMDDLLRERVYTYLQRASKMFTDNLS